MKFIELNVVAQNGEFLCKTRLNLDGVTIHEIQKTETGSHILFSYTSEDLKAGGCNIKSVKETPEEIIKMINGGE